MSALVRGAVAIESTRIAADADHFWVAVHLDARAAEERRVRLVLAIDRSSTMAGYRLAAAKRAALTLVMLARDGDELGLVTFDAEVRTVREPAPIDADSRAALIEAIDAVEAGRGTALAGATERALLLASTDASSPGEGHAIVLTDGFPFVGETDLEKIVALVSLSAQGATLSTIGFGDELDGPLLAAMAEAGLGRFVHLGEHDDLTVALAAELASAARALTRRAQITVQVRDACVIGCREVPDGQRAATVELSRPPLVAGERATWAFAIQPAKPLGAGAHSIGLVTVRTLDREGRPVVVELPIRIEVGARAGELDADVMRARCLGHAAKAIRTAVTSGADAREIGRMLERVAARIEGQASVAGLANDAAISAALGVLRDEAALMLAGEPAPRTAASAVAMGLEQGYDAQIGSKVSTMAPLRRESQVAGIERTMVLVLPELRPRS
ncbi:MAG: VWA domain-containing protein [Sandaracinus sp.]